MYCFGQNSPKNTNFKAGELLGYYGSVLMGLGTIYLANAALLQNEKFSQEDNLRREKDLAVSNYCLFMFEPIKIDYYDLKKRFDTKSFVENGYNGKLAFWNTQSVCGCVKMIIRLNITNIGNSPAVNVNIFDAKTKKKAEQSNVIHSNDEKHNNRYIMPKESGQEFKTVPLDNFTSNRYYLEFTNQFGSKYKQNVSIAKKALNLIEVSCEGTVNIDYRIL